MAVLKVVVLVFAGLVAVIATEAGAIAWLSYAPASLDLSGNHFTLTTLPVVLAVVLVAALLLWKIFAANPLRNCLIFGSVYLLAESFAVWQLGNSGSVIAGYALTIAGVCAVVFTLFTRFIWTR